MALLSILFRGDQQLEAAAVDDSAHITPGSHGTHVSKIQTALNRLDNANLEVDGHYGPLTANAVLAYKQKRNIINPSYQQFADNIVGRMTMVALDRELMGNVLLNPLEITDLGGKPGLYRTPKQLMTVARFMSAGNFGFVNVAASSAIVGTGNIVMPIGFTRHAPGTIGTIRCA
jgi:peptidoglycan hydrolase-like protein with peptidoglycan-binding domain